MLCLAEIERLIDLGASVGNLRIKVEIGFVAFAADGSTLLQIDATAGFPRRPAIASMLQPKAMRMRVAERAACHSFRI
jgi:hypothetical protein